MIPQTKIVPDNKPEPDKKKLPPPEEKKEEEEPQTTTVKTEKCMT
tara:strand:- start:115 stop:249 length:135 start_codon:yes stop_codon:yes gene_type:complete